MDLIKLFPALAAAVILACGCADSSSPAQKQETETVSQTESSEEEAPVDGYSAVIGRSLNRLGSTHRLKAKLEQARSGEKTTVAYIGGSITEGIGADKDTCYARLSYDFFAQTYGNGDNTEYVNAGLSGTPSVLGNLRLQRDVLDQNPDIVFIEFAVNDGQDNITKQSYESMVKTILDRENEPAVVLICNRLKNGYTAQEYMLQIAEFYDLPVVSIADALTPELDEGRMLWSDYSDDESHPNAYGHKLVSDCIANLFASADAADDTGEYSVRQGECFGTPYVNAVLLTPEILEEGGVNGIEVIDYGSFEPTESGTSGFPTSWKYNGGSDPIRLNVTANSISVIIRRNNSSGYGSFDVYLDGNKLKTISTNQSDGWGEAYAEQIIKYQSLHDMEIEIYPSEGSEDKSISLLGFAFTQNDGYKTAD